MRVFFLLLLLAGCQSETPKQASHFYGTAMTMNYHVIIGSPLTQTEKEKVQKDIDETFNRVNQIFNRYNPNSEISNLNKLPKNQTVRLSSDMKDLLKITSNAVSITDGKFDPTIHSLGLIWKKYLEKGELPPKNEIEEASYAVGWKQIHITGNDFQKDHDLIQLDLGGIAKGHCIDLIVKKLSKEGYSNLFVEWGGEIRALGMHPEKRPWMVMITRLDDKNPDRSIETLALNNEAIATSGDYLQYWKVGREKYCHIINPKTHSPLKSQKKSIASVTVKAPTCALADALATGAMIFDSVDDAKTWAENLQKEEPDLSFWFITR